MMRERKSSHKKCKSLKRGLQFFLPLLGRFWHRQPDDKAQHKNEVGACLRSVQRFERTIKNNEYSANIICTLPFKKIFKAFKYGSRNASENGNPDYSNAKKCFALLFAFRITITR